MMRMGKTLAFAGILLVLLAFGACNSDDESGQMAALVSHTDCKASAAAGAAAARDCVQYQFNGLGTLNLKHVNAGFNCCPGDLTAEITILDSVISIREMEKEAGCHCLCLYDLTYQVLNLPSGVYTIRFVEPYVPDADPKLEVTVNIATQPIGEFCVDRSVYPWL